MPIPSVEGPISVHVSSASTTALLLVGLAGVLVGGLLHLVIEHGLERARTRRRVQAAGQLLGIDLVGKLGAMIFIEQAPLWLEPNVIPQLTVREAWRECRADLSYSELDVWLTVARVYIELDGIEQLANRHKGTQVTEEHRKRAKTTATTITEAIAYLDVFARRPPWHKVRARIEYHRLRREGRVKMQEMREKRSQEG